MHRNIEEELLALNAKREQAELYFWHRAQKSSSAEVDFVIAVDTHIVPIEVKSGKTGTLKSLKIFMEERRVKFGVRISQRPLSLENNILSVPFYMIHQIPNPLSLGFREF